MKHALLFCGVLACAGALAQTSGTGAIPAAAASEPVATTASGAQQFALSNGMQLVVQPDHRAPTAVQMLWVRVGSMDEVNGRTGLAHMLEHMMFKGSASLGPGEFSRRVARLGGRENAFTTRDYTGYFQQIPAGRLKDVMQLEADRFAHNQWPDEEFRKELEVVKEERRMRTDDQPRAALMEQLNAATFMASPYHHPVVGWMSDLHSMQPEDARAFYRQWYVPGNAALVVAGDVQPQQVLAWAEEIYGKLPSAALPERKPQTEPEQRGLRRVSLKAPAEQAYVALAFRIPGMQRLAQLQPEDKDALSLLVLSAVLSGYDGARLDRELTQGPQRVADSAAAHASIFGRGPATFMLTGVPASGQSPEDVEQALRASVARVAREGVSAQELARVKAQWAASTIYARDSLMGQAMDLGSNWVQGLPLDADDRLLALLQDVAPADVQAVARRYFGDDQLTVGTLLPQALPEGAKARAPAAGADDGVMR
ncbi:M16 family metallopeptidase [Comamonas flocculans]|uniref:Insulinase family protein n=1 Tax=Comamonas flocculans TaxID=2597701 RepID=A0A5B8S055_9BURK|nr:pitrilysin family protein [Comamonas flocculans]QEA13637.1 insulinase family protein [Comamonas flocculans]